jgi:hypothetical protein
MTNTTNVVTHDLNVTTLGDMLHERQAIITLRFHDNAWYAVMRHRKDVRAAPITVAGDTITTAVLNAMQTWDRK